MYPSEFISKYNISRRKLASTLGVSLDTVHSWLAGRNNPSPQIRKHLQLVDRLIEIDPEYRAEINCRNQCKIQ